MIQYDICHTLWLVVSGDGHSRNSPPVSKQGVDGNNAFDGAIVKEPLRSLNHLLAMMVTDEKIEVVFLQKVMFDAAQDQGCIPLTDFRHEHADRLASSIA